MRNDLKILDACFSKNNSNVRGLLTSIIKKRCWGQAMGWSKAARPTFQHFIILPAALLFFSSSVHHPTWLVANYLINRWTHLRVFKPDYVIDLAIPLQLSTFLFHWNTHTHTHTHTYIDISSIIKSLLICQIQSRKDLIDMYLKMIQITNWVKTENIVKTWDSLL